MSDFVQCVGDANVVFRNARILGNTSDDLTLIILRAHLLTEELLRRILRKHTIDPSALKETRLTFFQVLRIVQALTAHPSRDSLWQEAENLNHLRNILAHRADPNIEQLVDAFLTKFPHRRSERDSNSPDRDRILALRGQLAQFLGALEFVLQKSPDHLLQRSPNHTPLEKPTRSRG
jgi:hypothetical protein